MTDQEQRDDKDLAQTDETRQAGFDGDLVHGDKVGGDRISVDQISGGAVAIGAGARVEIKQYSEIIVRPESIEDVPPAPGEPPFKGLAYFTEQDADIFFGREELSAQISGRLQKGSFLAVIGASGSGKSSLLRAAVVPLMRQRNWLITVSHPSAHPLQQLAAALTEDEASWTAADDLRAVMQENPRGLLLAMNKLSAGAQADQALLVIDQFEELFTLCRDETERGQFIDNLLTAVENGSGVTLLIGLRADFYNHCARYEGLRELVSQQQVYIGPMRQEDLVRVIAEPAKRGGWQFVDGLVEQILEDVGQEPGRLPLLSHALLETWRRRRGTVMTLGGYRAAGGVEGAIAKTAENTLTLFDERQMHVVEHVFLSLTELGEGSEDTRRIASREELARGDLSSLNVVLEDLVRARLITIDGEQVEVAHEALIRRWPRLGEWLRDNRERLRLERQLLRDAQEWENLEQDPGALYRGARLAQVQEWREKHSLQELTSLEQEFIEASIEAVEAQERAARQRRRRVFAALAAAALIFGFLALWALQQSRRALSRQLAAQAVSFSDSQGDLALLLALQAQQIDQSFETENGLLTALQTNPQISLYLHGPQKRVQKVLFSPDGQIAAAASDDNQVYLWDMTTMQPLSDPLPGHEATLRDLAFNSDGSLLASAGEDGRVILWDLDTFEPLNQWEENAPVASVAIGNEDQLLAFGDASGQLTIVDLDNFEIIAQTEFASSFALNSLKFSPVEALLAAGSYEGSIGLFDVEALQWREAPLSGDQRLGIWSVDFTPDGQFLASASEDGSIAVWDVAARELVGLSASEHDGAVYSLAFGPSGKRLISASEDGTMVLWEVAALDSDSTISLLRAAEQPLEQLKRYLGHGTAVWSASLDPRFPSSARAISGAADGSVALWDLADSQRLATLRDQISVPYWKIAVSPNGRWLAASHCGFGAVLDAVITCEAGSIFIYQLSDWQLAFTIDDVSGGSKGLAFSPDSRLLAYNACRRLREGTFRCAESEVQFWDMERGGTADLELSGHTDAITALAYQPDGRRLAASSVDGSILIWDVETGQPTGQPLKGHDGPVWDISFNRDGSKLASAGEDKRVIIWDAQSDQIVQEVSGHGERVLSLDFSREQGDLLAAGGWDNLVTLQDTAAAQIAPESLLGHTRAVFETVFSPDGKWLASGSGDEQIWLWDVARRQRLGLPLHSHLGPVLSMAFDPQRPKLYSAGSDGRLYEWNLSYDAWREMACRKANRSLTPQEWGFYFDVFSRLLDDDICSQ